MFTLLSGLYRHWTRKEEYYVLVLGLDNAGKTTLLEKVKAIYLGVQALPPERIIPTIGLNIGKIEIGGNMRLSFWDLGGQTDLRTIWNSYYSECHAIIFMVDSTDAARIEECKRIFSAIVTNDQVEGVPILMLANKQDMTGALKVEQIKELFNPIAASIGARDSKVMSVSALRGEGVREAVDWLHTRIQRNRQNKPPVYRNA